MSLLLLLACTDYGFSKGADGPGATRGTGEPYGSDSGFAADDPGGGGGGDDVPTDDACYEPEDGYLSNPAARLFTTDSTTPATVSFVYSDTDYDNELYLDAPVETLIVRAYADPVGTSVALGPFVEGTELVFGIDVLTTGDHWQSGPASRNSDGVDHVAVTYEGGCQWLIGFEDIYGGGDRDYNDVVLRVSGMLRQED